MARSRRVSVDYAVYLALRVALGLLQALPPRHAVAGAGALAWVAYRVDRRHRRVASENIAAAFPEWSAERVARTTKDCFRHFALMVVEIAVLPRKLTVGNWRSHASLVNARPVVAGLLRPRPVLIVTGHFGNWELAGYVLGALGFKTYAIARVLDNPHVEAFLKSFRQKTGQEIIAKKDDFDRLNRKLAGGAAVATLADQDAGPRGVFVPFFGRPASAHKAVALLALEHDAELVVVGVPRVGEFLRYEVRVADRIDPRDYAADPNPVGAITGRYHRALETLVRAHPEQYFWLHRRWKTRPKSPTT